MGNAAYNRGSKVISAQIDRELDEKRRKAPNYGPPIGRLRNNWRQRDVTVYATDDPEVVRTVGVPFGGGDAIITTEPIADWKRVISVFPRTAVFD